MTSSNHDSLWKRIEAFSLDEPGVEFPFSQRLARENRWTIAHARRAIDEYKRFMFLGCVAGHPVSPSEDVDQVWHLHLAYTQSYWTEFCGKILGRPFHHCPTKGGETESAKLENWYANTLESYRKFFGEEPPQDIWPPEPVHHDLSWIDRRAHWIVQKPRLSTATRLATFVMLIAAAGCASAGRWNVFDYNGPDFLHFFLRFAIVVFVVAAAVRIFVVASVRQHALSADNLSAYEIAYLAGGSGRAMAAVIVTLLDRSIIHVTARGDVQLQNAKAPETTLDPLEKTLVDGCTDGKSIRLFKLKKLLNPALDVLHHDLAAKGFLVDRDAPGRWIPLFLALLVPAVGLIKTCIGLSRGRPVFFVVFGTIAATIILLVFFARQPFRTSAGRKLLRGIRDQNANLSSPASLGSTSVLPMAVALFGVAALAGTNYAYLRQPLRAYAPDPASSSSGCSSSTSSCGSDGGGSSCGGGGGCGGCGGGGGGD